MPRSTMIKRYCTKKKRIHLTKVTRSMSSMQRTLIQRKCLSDLQAYVHRHCYQHSCGEADVAQAHLYSTTETMREKKKVCNLVLSHVIISKGSGPRINRDDAAPQYKHKLTYKPRSESITNAIRMHQQATMYAIRMPSCLLCEQPDVEQTMQVKPSSWAVACAA